MGKPERSAPLGTTQGLLMHGGRQHVLSPPAGTMSFLPLSSGVISWTHAYGCGQHALGFWNSHCFCIQTVGIGTCSPVKFCIKSVILEGDSLCFLPDPACWRIYVLVVVSDVPQPCMCFERGVLTSSSLLFP